MTKFNKSEKWYSIILGLISLGVLYVLSDNPDCSNGLIGEIISEVYAEEDGVVRLKAYYIDTANNQVEIEAKEFRALYYFKNNPRDKKKLDLSKNGEVLFCEEQQDYYKFIVEFAQPCFPNDTINNDFKLVLKNDINRSDCPFQLTDDDIHIINSNCNVTIKIKDSEKVDTDLWISINGKHGDYAKNRMVWNIGPDMSNQPADVWVVSGSDTLKSAQNESNIYNCVDPQEYDKYAHLLKDYAESYGNDPSNLNALAKFQQLSMRTSKNSVVHIHVGDQIFIHVQDFVNHTYQEYLNSDATYELVHPPTLNKNSQWEMTFQKR